MDPKFIQKALLILESTKLLDLVVEDLSPLVRVVARIVLSFNSLSQPVLFSCERRLDVVIEQELLARFDLPA